MAYKKILKKSYYNPYIKKEFQVLSVDKETNSVIIKVESEDVKTISLDLILGVINKSIEDKLPGYEQNLHSAGAEWISVIKSIKKRIQTPEEGMQLILSKTRQRYIHARVIPDEWAADIKNIESFREEIQEALSPNFWIYLLPDKVKGSILQRVYLSYMELMGYDTSRNETADYDGKVEGRLKEIKMSTISNGSLSFMQIRQFQEWQDLVLIVVLPSTVEIYEKEKNALMNWIVLNPECQNWAGGKEKRKRLDNDIRKNDLFHLGISYDQLKSDFERIYNNEFIR